MRITTNEELKLFEETIRLCSSPLWLITANGTGYDLKDPIAKYLGIAELLRPRDGAEPELYASSHIDEMRVFDYLYRMQADHDVLK